MKCSGCNRPHRRTGQRYCKRCHADAQARYRAKLKRERAVVARFVKRHLRHTFEARASA